MKVRLTVLAENTTSRPATLGEEGLSVLIEAGTNVILLDTGQTISTVFNAAALGLDLSRVEKIVLSHGHFDHTGGLRSVLRRMRKKVEVVCHPDAWAPKYAVGKDGAERYIGIPFQRLELENLGARFAISRDPVVISEDVTALGEVPMENDFETIDPHLFVRDGSGLRPDDLLDDRAVVIDSGEGLVVVLGCAHRGIVNTLKQAQKLTGVDRINLVVGGSHLVGSAEERVWQTVAALREMNVERLGLCHCTSLPAAAILAREFGDGFFFNNVGKVVEAGQ